MESPYEHYDRLPTYQKKYAWRERAEYMEPRPLHTFFCLRRATLRKDGKTGWWYAIKDDEGVSTHHWFPTRAAVRERALELGVKLIVRRFKNSKGTYYRKKTKPGNKIPTDDDKIGKRELVDEAIVLAACEATTGFPHSITNPPQYNKNECKEVDFARKLEWQMLYRYSGYDYRKLSAMYGTVLTNIHRQLQVLRRNTNAQNCRYKPEMAFKLQEVKQFITILRGQQRTERKKKQQQPKS